MAPSVLDATGHMLNGFGDHKIDTMNPHDLVYFDKRLTPKKYEIKGTKPDSKILFSDVNIIDSTGADPFRGDVYIEGELVSKAMELKNLTEARRAHQGCRRNIKQTVSIDRSKSKLGELGVEEHTLVSARSAQTYLDSGYTMAFGAASAKERLDVVIRDAINDGKLPGPRYLANGKEMAVPDGELVPGITAFASGPLEMRETIRHHVKLGVDTIKLSMSGEQITETRDAQDCYYSHEETAACVDEAHRLGVRLCAHARARDSVKQCIQHGVDIIYHASWIDEEGMQMLDENKIKHIVAPGINWLIATIYEASAFGYAQSKAEEVGYKKELDAAIKGLKEMHRRGITVLPGGDYGFAWTPHGTYARDLEHFVKLLDFTPMETLVASTAGVAKLFMREDELGKIKPGYYADCILVDGDPIKDITVLQDHDKLNVIMINGRIHKASYKEFIQVEVPKADLVPEVQSLTNYVAYALDDGTHRTRIGHLDIKAGTITPLSFPSGTPFENLYQAIEVGSDQIVAGDDPFPLTDDINILPPISGRDILAVGKNYAEHAEEFHASGYDSSDKVSMPSHPVIFTKRATSIIANEEEILLHEGFTETLDYEGEIGVIIGKSGFQISEAEASQYIWGYTIINDVTAREKQRDHKQFFIGKSADSYCPMGPIAVPAHALPEILTVTTKVNGEKRQESTIDKLIFSIPKLIETLSQSQTLRPGDVIATGTPMGVGFGLKPPTFLKPGDMVEISVTGLGTLRNKVSEAKASNYVAERVKNETSVPVNNLSITSGGLGLTTLPQSGKRLDVQRIGSGLKLLVFMHGLGGNKSFFSPLLAQLGLNDPEHKQYTSLLYDFEGHGLSPTSARSTITVSSLADDLYELLKLESLALPTNNQVTLIAHSMACLVAELFASRHPDLAHQLILIGPPPCPLPQAGYEASTQRAAKVRAEGMRNVAVAVSTAGTSAKTRKERPVAFTAVQMSLMSQDPEGYAKGCTALASARDSTIDLTTLGSEVLIVAGEEDKVSPKSWAEKLNNMLAKSRLEILPDVGHWHCFEDVEGVANAIRGVLL
ncbi:hypothetical protein LTR05_007978 [Lithohypha guttulata]|uniref:Fumarylacetoacetate hydrolase n=1 Tax=Lithohypha guttulata TaxID=1690604 RepID=A0AAN7YD25_9EURO|nr:hypothetical protein LTR05_007978 [Lithohypha guttulata]